MSEDVGYRVLRAIRQIIRQVSRHSRDLAERSGLTVPQLLCLRAIDELEGDVTLASVSDAVGLSRSTTSGIVERLVRAGLVDRVRSTEDRRRISLSVTEDGAARLGSLPEPLQERFIERLGDMAPADQGRLVSALEEVAALMEAEELDAAPMLTPGVDLSSR